MESKLPPEIVFQILQQVDPKSVSQYMQASTSTLESGQEIKKSKVVRLMKQVPKSIVDSAMKKVNPQDPLYWSKLYRQIRVLYLSSQIKDLINNKLGSDRTATLIELGNLLIPNRDIFATMNKFKKEIRMLLREHYLGPFVRDQDKGVIEIIYLELFPEHFEEDFGFGLDQLFS
jgi:hypothetical protein